MLSKIFDAFISSQKEPYLDVNFDKLPVKIDVSPAKINTNFAIGFGILWSISLALCIIAFIFGSKTIVISGIVFMAVLWAVGFLVLSQAFDRQNTRHIITLHDKHVAFHSKQPRKPDANIEISYKQYNGLMLTGKKLPTKTAEYNFQQITLVHDDPQLNVLLYQLPESPAVLEQVIHKRKAIAKILRVAILRKDSGKLEPTPWHQVDHNLAQRETISSIFQGTDGLSGENAPRGLRVSTSRMDGQDIITINPINTPLRLVVKIGLTLISIAMFNFAEVFTSDTVMWTIIGAIIFIPTSIWIFLGMVTSERLIISREQLILPDSDKKSFEGNGANTMNIADIESITIDGPDRFSNQLTIHGKNGRLSYGNGLSKTKLLWLQSYLKAAIVTA